MRKNIGQAAEYFPQDVMDLRIYFDGQAEVALKPNPGWGASGIEMWMLGSASTAHNSPRNWACPMPSPAISRRIISMQR